jgi:H/ACA ribonucleoprotein complex subunit 2
MSNDEKKVKKDKKEKKEKKSKKEKQDTSMTDTPPAPPSAEKAEKASEKAPVVEYEERIKAVNCISTPLASKKTTKKVHKLVKKASGAKWMRRGVKEVVKGLRKGEKGVAVIAGDIYPIDVISHLPVLLEEAEVPYIFVPSKVELGAAASTKRPTSCVLLREPKSGFDAMDLWNDVKGAVASEGK